MAGLRISLGRCDFCGGPGSKKNPVLAHPERRARICRDCVESFLAPRARASAETRDVSQGVRELEAALLVDPNDLRARLELGDLYATRKSSRLACEQYRQVAEAYVRDGFFLKAVAVYKQILKLEPDGGAHVALAETYRRLGLTSDAVDQYSLAAIAFDAVADTDGSLRALRALVELAPDGVLARERIAQLAPTDRETLLWLARQYLERHNPQRALARMLVLLRANPRDVEALELIHAAFVALGSTAKAEAVRAEIEAARTAAPSQPLALTVPEPTDQVPAAEVVAEFRRAVEQEIGRGDLRARFELGYAYKEMGLWDEAIAEFTLAAADPALAAEAHGMIGLCHMDAGRLADAIAAFTRAIKTPGAADRQKATWFFAMATALAAQGDATKAHDAFKQAVALDPDTPREDPSARPR